MKSYRTIHHVVEVDVIGTDEREEKVLMTTLAAIARSQLELLSTEKLTGMQAELATELFVTSLSYNSILEVLTDRVQASDSKEVH